MEAERGLGEEDADVKMKTKARKGTKRKAEEDLIV